MNEVIRQFLVKEFEETKRTHQLRQLFERYKAIHADVVQRFATQHSCPTELVIAALYCSDYIITNSELKEPIDDESRVEEIIHAFKNHLHGLSANQWLDLTYFVAFVFRVSSIIRKRYYFLLDKGVDRGVAASYVADLFISPLIEYCSTEASFMSLAWISILVEAALVQSIFSEVQDKRGKEIGTFEVENIGTHAHFIAYNFSFSSDARTNTSVPLPYVNDSNLIYHIKWRTIGDKQHSVFGTTINQQASQLEKKTKNFVEKISSDTNVHVLKYLRSNFKAKAKDQEKNIFLVHANSENAEGWIILLSAVDDINVKFIETLLQQKLSDLPYLSEIKSKLPKIYFYPEDVSKAVEQEEQEQEKDKPPEEKVSLIKRILSLFKKKKHKPLVTKKPKPPKTSSYDVIKEIFAKELLIACVAGIDLGINIYDDFREDMFEINGVFVSKKEQAPPTQFVSETLVSYPAELLDPIIESIDYSKELLFLLYNDEPLYIYPEEALFIQKEVNLLRLIECVHKENLLVGTVSDKQTETRSIFKKKTPAYKRRSIQKKTRELQSALKVHSLQDAIVNILPTDIDPKNLQTTSEDKLIFFSS